MKKCIVCKINSSDKNFIQKEGEDYCFYCAKELGLLREDFVDKENALRESAKINRRKQAEERLIQQVQKPNRSEYITLTTTNNIDGFKVVEYIDIVSVEVVLGTGFISEIGAGLSDLLGARAEGFENKLASAKKLAFQQLREKAFDMKGNAVIGIDVDYTLFNKNIIGVVANGTVVVVEKDPIDRRVNFFAGQLDVLQRLAELKEQGLLTELEFEEKKKILLA